MIEIKNIHKNFGKLTALNNVSLSMDKGQSIALIGPNGSGKTTLIKCILGMVLPDKGAIFFDEKNIANDYLYRRNIGYMPQIGRYPENMTIGQVIKMMRDVRDEAKDFDEELIEKYNLKSLYHKRMRTLSGGTRQKVSACIAFLFNPDVLILDEPTAGLDPISSEILKEKIIKEKNNNKLIIISSHILSELDDVVSHLLYMNEGELMIYQPVEQLREQSGEEKLAKAITKIFTTTADAKNN
ncbi:ABC transporter ATP-binding protein [Haoranjiania flava]|uniref:ABC transporter ATP-binding protein n=1 Tax=Haoranjiania flava TaxID=1856322 RepID=A0AAE3INS8_9BACT|nr:ABC transporter ATP-binding protein [Haoranjiania flava]MCU7694535.1 ABC transporter ATP-binding protein [Haoranjiania flava]